MTRARRYWQPLASAACALWLLGCASQQHEADALAHALARRVRLHYDQRLAIAGVIEAPEADVLEVASRDLDAALARARVLPLAGAEDPSEVGPAEAASPETASPDGDVRRTGSWSAAARASRTLLLRHDWVFPPPSGTGEAGIVIARVVERTTGLSRMLWGRTWRYRRVRHESPILQDYRGHVALRFGVGGLPPAARWTDQTVFLDVDTLRRRAGQGPYVDVSAEALEEHLDLQQVAAMEAAKAVDLDALAEGLPALQREAAARIWLTLLAYGDAHLVRRRLRYEARHKTPWGDAAAFVAQRALTPQRARALRAELAAGRVKVVER